jgi:DNA-binding XRE family transcriptional regulator
MGILEIIAERRIGIEQLAARPNLRASLSQVDRAATNAESTEDEKARVESIIELCFEYERETDPDEKNNILLTLEEVSANESLELPTVSIEDRDARLKIEEPAYPKAAKTETQRLEKFRRKYFSLRAKAGLSTQAALAKKSGLRRSYISIIETGDHFPQQKTLQKLAEAFGVDVTELLP